MVTPRSGWSVFVVASATGVACLALTGGAARVAIDELEGIEPGRARLVPSVQAAFERESYRPGQHAKLVVRHHSPALAMQVFQSGPSACPLSPTRT